MTSTSDCSKISKTDSGDDESLSSNMSEKANISMLNDDCLEAIFSYLSIKERLKIQRVCKTWQKVSKSSCRKIRHLEIGSKLFGNNYYGKTKEVLLPSLNQALVLCGSGLKSIKFDSSFSSDVDCLKMIKQSCPQLQSIYLSECNTDIAIFFIENFTNLSSISLEFCYKNSEKLLSEYFSKNENLTSLSIGPNDHLTGSCLLSLPESLESLTIRFCKKILPENIGKALQKLLKLKSLTLFGDLKFIETINTILDRIPMNSTIEKLHIKCVSTKRSKKAIDRLNYQSLSNLRVINLEGNVLCDDNTLYIIAENCKKLTDASFTDCEYVFDAGLQPFVESLKLESLFIFYARILSVNYLSTLKCVMCHCCHYVYESDFVSLIQTSKVLEILDIIYCDEVHVESMIEKALKAHTRDEFLELNVMDRNGPVNVKIAASRLYIMRDTSKRLSR